MREFRKNIGSCHIIIGPMYAGKSTQLIQELTTCADVGLNVLYINHSFDQRKTEASDDNVSTHHSQFVRLNSKIFPLKTGTLSEIDVKDYDVIGIDEGQFYPDLNLMVRRWVLELNKTVVIAGLDGDFKMETFGQILQLIPIAESVVKKSAICMKCLNNPDRIRMEAAFFTGKKSSSGPQIEVGGTDKYESLCMKCHRDQMTSKSTS